MNISAAAPTPVSTAVSRLPVLFRRDPGSFTQCVAKASLGDMFQPKGMEEAVFALLAHRQVDVGEGQYRWCVVMMSNREDLPVGSIQSFDASHPVRPVKTIGNVQLYLDDWSGR